jgi:hypothetical protein
MEQEAETLKLKHERAADAAEAMRQFEAERSAFSTGAALQKAAPAEKPVPARKPKAGARKVS